MNTHPQPNRPAVRRPVRGGKRDKLTLTDILEDLDVSRSTFHDWRAKGRAPRCIKLPNGELRIRRTDYDKWLETLESEGRA
ncbi:MAG: helix-turn-helix transcriptional regulator [Nocardioides sp.]